MKPEYPVKTTDLQQVTDKRPIHKFNTGMKWDTKPSTCLKYKFDKKWSTNIIFCFDYKLDNFGCAILELGLYLVNFVFIFLQKNHY